MSSSGNYAGYYYPAASQPIAMPHKQQNPYYPQYQQPTAYRGVSVSPPEAPDSVTTSGGISYDPSGTSSSYAASASASEYEASSSSGGTSVDLLEYMNDRLATAFNPTPLDRSMAQQAQTSGQLNDKTRQLLELQAMAQARMAAARSSFAEGIKTAKEVQRDLEWTQKRVNSMNQRAARKYPQEYAVAQERYPPPVDY